MNPNQRTLGKYEIIEELGRGAFATVYRALDTTLDREVALKILHPPLLTDPTFIGRFQREARTMAQLDHPHIATVYEVGETEGRVYIALYLAQGPNLSETLGEQGHTSWEKALALLQPICAALDYAHGRGVVHRDLKPSNILLDSERGPLLTDFGFAHLMGDSSVSLSLSGGILGTPAYIAPEVWELDAAEPPVDMYALGCITYEMLTGEVLFAGKTPMQAMRAHDQGPHFPQTWSEDVPLGIKTVLNKALARDPAARYPSGTAFWHALHDLETQAQAAQEAVKQAAVAAQWREETEVAMAAAEWRVAKMAVARWLAVVPNDAGARAAQVEIEQQLGKPTNDKSVSTNTSSQKAENKSHVTTTPSEHQTRARAVPTWLWVDGGVIGIFGVGFLLIMLLSGTFIAQVVPISVTNTPRPSRTPQPTATSTSTSIPTATPTTMPARTPRLTTTPTAMPTRAPTPTNTTRPTSTPLPTHTATPTLTAPTTTVRTSHPAPVAVPANQVCDPDKANSEIYGQIAYPQEYTHVRTSETIQIIGTAAGSNFERYTVKVAVQICVKGSDIDYPCEGYRNVIGYGTLVESAMPVTCGLLATIDTSSWPPLAENENYVVYINLMTIKPDSNWYGVWGETEFYFFVVR